MSQFIGFESFLVPLGATIADAQAAIETAITSRNWQLLRSGLVPSAMLGNLGTVANAFDGSSAAVATSAAGLPLWIGCQTPTPFTPTKVLITGAALSAECPNAFTIDWSNDGSSWTTHQTVTGEANWIEAATNGYSGETRSYAIAGAPAKSYWRINVTAKNGGTNITIPDVMFMDAANKQIVNWNMFEVIPPVTETIGGNGAFESVVFSFGGSSIAVYPTKKWTTAKGQQVYIKALTAGAVTCSATLSGQTVSYTGVGGNSAYQNLLGLYDAIRSSVNATWTAWDWEISFPPTQNADDSATYIYGINRTAGPVMTFTGSNVTAALLTHATGANWPLPWNFWTTGVNLTMDLINGFIYYIQVSARGIALATKTNANYYGPVHACYCTNAAQVAYLPVDNQFVTVQELLVGYDDASTDMDSWGRCAGSVWMMAPICGGDQDWNGTYTQAQPGSGMRRHRWMDALCNSVNGNAGTIAGQSGNRSQTTLIRLFGSGMFYDDSQVGNDFQIHRVKCIGASATPGSFAPISVGYPEYLAPGWEVEDWFKFRGTATNESLTLVADTVATTGLAAKFTIGDTTMVLTDASSFQTAGFVVIGNEAFQYTGKSGNNLTGVTGGKYATIAVNHYIGDKVGQGLWFVLINGGAILAGYNKPT
jgi:hypothetical protein